MTSVPTTVLVTQWLLLFALSALVIVMYRQLAHLLRLSGSANDAGGLEPGVAATPFTYRHPGDPTVRTFTPGGGQVVLLFTDPRCGACVGALQAMEHVVPHLRPARPRVLVVTAADETSVIANETLGRTPFEVALVDDRVLSQAFRVTATPLMLGLDADGTVRSRVAGPDRAAVRRSLRELMHTSTVDTSGAAAAPDHEATEVRT